MRESERERNGSNLICSLTADSDSSTYFWRAREACGTVGTRSSSFFTSSNGSKITPVRARWFVDPFAARTTNPRAGTERGGSAFGLKRERDEAEAEAAAVRRSMVSGSGFPRSGDLKERKKKQRKTERNGDSVLL